MARLPQPGGDTGTWGDVLNDYLSQSHKTDGSLKDNIVTTSVLAAGAVDNAAVADNSLNASKILDDSISETKLDVALLAKVNALGSDPVVGGDLSGSASNAQIVADAVGTAELASQSVTTAKIADANVTTLKLANGSVDDTKLASDAVTNVKILDGTIAEVKLDAALTAKVNGSASVADGTLTPIKLSSDAPATGEVLSYNGTGFEWVTQSGGGGSGETNTTTNIGTGGVGVYKQKVGVQFELKRVRAASSKITVTDNVANNTVDLDVSTGSLGLTKSDVGLGNVDNTSDVNKPVSTATTTALNAKAATATTVTGTQSVSGGGSLAANRTLSLVNDATSPGNSQYYGTNGSGTKGYFALPGGSDPAVGGDLSGTASNAQIVANAVGTTEIAASAVTDAKVATGIAQSKISNLTTDLAAKAATVHTHAAGDIVSGTVATARLGSGTANGTTYLRGDGTWATPAGGGSSTNVIARSTTYTAVAGDFIIATVSGGAFNITLPAATTGSRVSVKKVDASANAVTVIGTIDNLSSFALSTQWASQDFIADGTQWYLI